MEGWIRLRESRGDGGRSRAESRGRGGEGPAPGVAGELLAGASRGRWRCRARAVRAQAAGDAGHRRRNPRPPLKSQKYTVELLTALHQQNLNNYFLN